MIEIIPAIDLIDGQCVRLEHGDYKKKSVYSSSPVEVAKKFEAAGLKSLHLVDLDGAKAGSPINLNILEKITNATSLKIDFSGGLRSKEDIQKVLDAGAQEVVLGSLAYKDSDLFQNLIQTFKNIVLGADVKENKIAIHGWQDITEKDVFDYILDYHKQGIKRVLCTDISRDGVFAGPALKLYQEIKTKVPDVELIASGGVSSMQDLRDLDKIGIEAVVVGKALYEDKISLEELKEFLC